MSILIRPARAADAVLLPDVERDSGTLFKTIPELAWVSSDEVAPAEMYLPLIDDGTVWVAEDAGAIAGFLSAQAIEDALHIWEVAVATAFQHQGIGRRLMRAAEEYARRTRMNALTLTTFTHVPWNAPFYENLGYRTLSAEDVTDFLAAVLQKEEERGLPNRCAMQLAL